MPQIISAIISLGKIFGYFNELQRVIIESYYDEQIGKLDERHARVADEMKFLTTKLKGAQTDEDRKYYNRLIARLSSGLQREVSSTQG